MSIYKFYRLIHFRTNKDSHTPSRSRAQHALRVPVPVSLCPCVPVSLCPLCPVSSHTMLAISFSRQPTCRFLVRFGSLSQYKQHTKVCCLPSSVTCFS